MRKIIVSEFLTLDGVMEDPGGADGTPHGGWSFQFGQSAEQGKFKVDELFASDALLLGRKTYQGFAAAWPTMQGTGEFGERMNSIAKYVVSTTLQTADWNNSHLIKTNVVEAITQLKQQDGRDILVGGSGALIQTLIQHDLVDQYRLLVFPLMIGSGRRLFRDGTYATLKLLDSQSYSTGVVSMVYQADRKA